MMACIGESQWDWREVHTSKIYSIGTAGKNEFFIKCGGRGLGRGTANDPGSNWSLENPGSRMSECKYLRAVWEELGNTEFGVF